MARQAIYASPTWQEICEERSRVRVSSILTLVAHGHTDVEIGKKLHLSEHTIKHYMREIFLDLNVRNRAHAVYVAVQRGIIE